VAERRPHGRVLPGSLAVRVLACLLLAGCSAGVPRTGQVTAVSRVAPSSERDVTNSGVGRRPTVGLKPAELVQEYLRAAASGDPDMARPWVVPDDPDAARQLRAWTQRHAALVYSNPTTKSADPSGRGNVKVVIEVSMVGHFDGRDWTPLAEERRLEFRLRRVGTEWRVANPGDEPLMSEDDFKERFRRITLYMVARDHRHLVPTPTFLVQDAAAAETDEGGVEARAEQVLRLLLDGPRGRLAPGMTTEIPAGTRLQSFDYAPAAGLATVNLSSEFTAPGEAGSGRLRVAQLVCTLTELIRTAQVRIQVDGRQVDAVGSDRFRTDHPYRGNEPELDALLPRRPGSEHVVAFVRAGEVNTVPLDVPNATPKVLPLPPSGTKLHPVWSPDGDRIAYLETAGGTGSDLELWTASASGAAAVKTGLHGNLSEPTWVPSDPPRLLALQHEHGKARLWSVAPYGDSRPVELSLGRPPGGMDPTLLRVSADGGLVLAVMGSKEQAEEPATFGAGSDQLFLGVLGDRGVTQWVGGPLAPGLGEVHSPVWADPDTIAFVGEAGAKGSKALWTTRIDGWDPTQVLSSDRTSDAGIDIADQLTADPSGHTLVFKSSTDLASSLWLVNVDGRGLRALTTADPSNLDTDPTLASG
jgi:hypothetical protein